MNMRLVMLEALGNGDVAAVLEVDPGAQHLEAIFRVEEVDGIMIAASSPDVFRSFDGTAEEARQIVAAVIAFYRCTS